jgi:hypothetical protein
MQLNEPGEEQRIGNGSHSFAALLDVDSRSTRATQNEVDFQPLASASWFRSGVRGKPTQFLCDCLYVHQHRQSSSASLLNMESIC